jgi:hypothetical protein
MIIPFLIFTGSGRFSDPICMVGADASKLKRLRQILTSGIPGDGVRIFPHNRDLFLE